MKPIKKSPILFGLISLIAFFTFAKQEKILQIFRNGEIIQEYAVDNIDYIEVNNLIPAPDNVNASVTNDQITIKWNPVEGATYNIYRSPDNVKFTLLASNLTETTYTDTKPLRGSNFYRIKAVVGDVESGYTSPAAATLTSSELDNGIYLGITGFNQTLYEHPVLQLTESSVDGFRDFVKGLTMKNGTLLYYSVDQALNAMQSTELPSNISTAAIVTFTDGLDQGSMMMDIPYDDDMAYLDALNRRIKNETVCGQPITAYSIGIRGKDVSDISMFSTNLAKLASSTDNATEVTSMADVNAKFKEIAEKLSQSNYVQTINLKMPGLSNGTRVRFTFDNANAADKSRIYIEGKFNLKNKSLEEVQYVGLTSTSGTTVKGTVDGIFVSFTFDGIHTDNNVLIKSEFTDEWTFITSNSSWQINSEFDKTENSDIVTERSSAVIMLVLDCSSSLAEEFVKVQTNAQDFINVILENAKNPNEVSGVSLNLNELNIHVGKSYKLIANVIPSTALLKKVLWTSSNDEIANVNQDGLVTALSSGHSTITVTTQDGGYSDVCEVNVLIPVSSISLNTTSLNLTSGDNYSLVPTISPSNASVQDLLWSTSDNSVATVDSNGNVTAIAFGTAIVTATTTDGTKITSECFVKVSEPGHGFIHGHEFVDLGLPSGLKWATCNIDAQARDRNGNDFAWGETNTKSSYTQNNSATHNVIMSDFSGNSLYDPARKNMGSTWRVPTKTEFEELINNCTWEYTWLVETIIPYGVGGFKVTGPNGRQIFFPIGSSGTTPTYYWTSTPTTSTSPDSQAYCVRLGGNYKQYVLDTTYRYFGLLVRPVSD